MPHSLDAERSVLGSAMLDGDAARLVATTLTVDDFHGIHHQTVYESIKALVSGGSGVDLVTVKDHLSGRGKLSEVGGVDVLISLCDAVVAIQNLPHHARMLQDKTVARRVIERGTALVNAAVRGECAVADLVSQASALGSGLMPGAMHVQDWDDVDINQPPPPGVRTNVELIDRMTTCPGLPRGRTTLVAAPTNAGKTALVAQMARSVAAAAGHVCYATYEMPAHEIKRRMMRQMTGCWRMPSDPNRRRYDDLMTWNQAEDAMRFALMEFFDPSHLPGAAYPVEEFAAWVSGVHTSRPFDLICVDYAQLLKTTDRSLKGHEITREVSRVLKQLARYTDAAVVVATQMTGDQIRDSKDLENDAGFALELQPVGEPKPNKPVPLRVVIRKNTYGPAKAAMHGLLDHRTGVISVHESESSVNQEHQRLSRFGL